MTDTDDLTAYSRLADQLINKASKEELADVARLLALNIGYYYEKHGDVPQDVLLKMVRADTLDDETKRLLLQGMQNLASALATVMGVTQEGTQDEIH